MFTEQFSAHVSDGDFIECEVDGFTARATLHIDDDTSPPWKREDGHGEVSEWTRRDKKPGELVLNADHGNKRFYDYAAACRTALADGWGAEGGLKEGETPRQHAARAAMQDYEVLRAWCADGWYYYGVAVTISRAGIALTGPYDHASWGIAGNYPGDDNSYFSVVANEFLDAAVEQAKAMVATLAAGTPTPATRPKGRDSGAGWLFYH
jgi:hypothetical protein